MEIWLWYKEYRIFFWYVKYLIGNGSSDRRSSSSYNCFVAVAHSMLYCMYMYVYMCMCMCYNVYMHMCISKIYHVDNKVGYKFHSKQAPFNSFNVVFVEKQNFLSHTYCAFWNTLYHLAFSAIWVRQKLLRFPCLPLPHGWVLQSGYALRLLDKELRHLGYKIHIQSATQG